MDSAEVNIDILSFDGGGSRGIMEVSLLNDVMRMATIVLNYPQTVQSYLCGTENNVLEDIEIRKRLIADLKGVSDPLHPTEVYEMIVGTSTGALIAFGLVGGKETEDGRRIPMSLEECIEMYLQKTKAIFTKSWSHWFLSGLPGFSSIPLTTYPQDNVKKILLEQFGDSSLGDLHVNGSKCVAGAVARKLGSNEELVLFDTKSEDYKFYKTHQVLLATSNAPVYFDTPVRIGNDEFVDGGVGGNCPLVQAIPRAKEIFGHGGKDAEITSALSIAPPASNESEVPRRFQIKYWLNYFVHRSTDGYAVYRDAVKRNKNKKTLFRRLSPRGKALKKFKLDEVDAQNMLDAVEKEKLNTEMFLIDVIATAMVVVDTSVKKAKANEVTTLTVAAQLAQTSGNVYSNNKEYESAVSSYKTSISLWKKIPGEENNDLTISKIYHEIANCLKKQEKYPKAISLYRLNLQHLKKHQDKSNDEIMVDSFLQLGRCLVLSFRYKEAEKCYHDVLNNQKLNDGILKLNPKLQSRILTDLAWSVHKQGKLDEAFHLYDEAEKLTEGDSHDRAETLNNLGLCFLDLTLKVKAQEFINKALEMRKHLCKEENDAYVSESLNNLGVCLIKGNDYDGAEEKLAKALEMFKRNGDEISVAISSSNLAKCLSLKNGDQNLAMAYVQQALDRMKKCIGDLENPGIAKTLTVAGLCFLTAKRNDEAMEYFEKAERMTSKLFGSNHPSLEEIYRYLSELFYKAGKKEILGKHYQMKAANIGEKIKEMKQNVEKYL